MRNILRVILLFAMMALFLASYHYLNSFNEIGITKAQAARMIVIALYPDEEVTEKRELIDVDDAIWYAPYIQIALHHNLLQTNGDLFYPSNYLTYGEVKKLAQELQLAFRVPFFQSKKKIPLSEWLAFYDTMTISLDNVQNKNIQIAALPSTSNELNYWQAMTNEGIFDAEGLALDNFVHKTVKAYISGNRLLMAVPLKEGEAEEVIEAAESSEETQDESGTETNHAEQEFNIRVCLMTTNYTSDYHDSITFTSDEPWNITFSDATRQCDAGEEVTLSSADFSENKQTAKITTKKESRITVKSIEKSYGCPSYEGTLEVINTEDGLLLINELSLEHYLYGVVPGEMPANYPEEALKSQAVCARSFAMACLASPKYDFADVSDSTASQVYMNQGTDERTTEAVDETRGKVLKMNGETVAAKYFSSSSGSLSKSSDIWIGDASNDAHIVDKLEMESPTKPNLSDEAAFRDFIDSPEPDVYIEENEDWFRWSTSFSLDRVKDNIRNCLKQRMYAAPDLFTLLSDNGEFDPENIISIEVIERAASGVAKKLQIRGENQELTISGEYNIRSLLAPSAETVFLLNDGSRYSGLALLPSGYFYIDFHEAADQNEAFLEFHGGGLGHGTGLSQNGASVLAKKGYGYEEILKYYFEGIEITN